MRKIIKYFSKKMQYGFSHFVSLILRTQLANRGILVYNIYLICISSSPSEGATNKFVLNIKKVTVIFAQNGLLNRKECVSSLALLPPRNFAVLNYNFSLNKTPKELHHRVLSFTSSLAARVNSCLICFPFICKAVCK